MLAVPSSLNPMGISIYSAIVNKVVLLGKQGLGIDPSSRSFRSRARMTRSTWTRMISLVWCHATGRLVAFFPAPLPPKISSRSEAVHFAAAVEPTQFVFAVVRNIGVGPASAPLPLR
jgi:hypothetical protein